MWSAWRRTWSVSGCRSGSPSCGWTRNWNCRCSGRSRGARADMDFTPTEEQTAARELAARIFGDLATHERLTAAGTGSDMELWKALCAAGLVSAVEDVGLLGLVLILEEQGRTTAQVPFAASCAYG